MLCNFVINYGITHFGPEIGRLYSLFTNITKTECQFRKSSFSWSVKYHKFNMLKGLGILEISQNVAMEKYGGFVLQYLCEPWIS